MAFLIPKKIEEAYICAKFYFLINNTSTPPGEREFKNMTAKKKKIRNFIYLFFLSWEGGWLGEVGFDLWLSIRVEGRLGGKKSTPDQPQSRSQNLS